MQVLDRLYWIHSFGTNGEGKKKKKKSSTSLFLFQAHLVKIEDVQSLISYAMLSKKFFYNIFSIKKRHENQMEECYMIDHYYMLQSLTY